MRLALVTIPGAVLGAVVAVRLEDLWFQRILGIIMILIVLTMFLPKLRDKNEILKNAQTGNWRIYFALAGIGFYGGFIQVGVGFLLMAALFHILHLSLVKVNIHKVFIILIYVPFPFGFDRDITYLLRLEFLWIPLILYLIAFIAAILAHLYLIIKARKINN